MLVATCSYPHLRQTFNDSQPETFAIQVNNIALYKNTILNHELLSAARAFKSLSSFAQHPATQLLILFGCTILNCSST